MKDPRPTCAICHDDILEGQSTGSSRGEVVHVACWSSGRTEADRTPRKPPARVTGPDQPRGRRLGA
jgi:hypothetical protein